MKRYLLDTNVVSELRKPKPHGGVVSWLRSLRDEQIFLSAVTLGELQIGVERLRRQDAGKAEQIEAWLERLASSVQVLAMDAPYFRQWARLIVGRSDAVLEDAMIAATALVHGLIVATRNERDFQPVGVALLNRLFRALDRRTVARPIFRSDRQAPSPPHPTETRPRDGEAPCLQRIGRERKTASET